MTGADKKVNRIFVPLSMFLLGAVLGVVSKMLDIHTSNLGNIFSQMSV